VSVEERKEFLTRRGIFLLWAGLLVPPAAWLLQLQAAYLMVYVSCATGGNLAYHLASLAALAVAAAGGLLSWRNWRRAGPEVPGERGGPLTRSRFMALLGVLTGALFSVVIIAQWLPGFILPPCNK
jgi:hypothetical protein